jgi:UDP-2,3-diacylglucosamine hydrolase
MALRWAVLGHTLVVVADAHLGPAAGADERRLLAFLEQVPGEGDALLVAGDLFEFWFGYGRVIPRHGFRVAAALARLRAQLPVVMVGGNHDRWDRGFWRDDLGLEYHAHQADFEIGRRRVRAVHGDGLTDRRWASRLLHRLVSAPLTSTLYRALPPDVGFPLVERLTPLFGDRHATEATRALAAAHRRAWAEATLHAEPSVDVLIMGHTHRHALVEIAPGREYLNPGPWFDGGRHAVVTERGSELRRFVP